MKIGGGDAKELAARSPGRDELRTILETTVVGAEIKMEVKRKAEDKTETLKLRLGALSDFVPESLPPNATARHALEPRKQVPRPAPEPGPGDRPKTEEKPKTEPKPEEKKVETGFLERSTPAKDHTYWLYVPANYDPNVSHALVIWLHAGGQGGKDAKDMVSIWRDVCEEQHIILVGPKSESETGWLASEAEFVQEAGPRGDQGIHDRPAARRSPTAWASAGNGVLPGLQCPRPDPRRGHHRRGARHHARKTISPASGLAFFVVAGAKDPARQRNRRGATETRREEVLGDLPRSRRHGQRVSRSEDVRRNGSLDRFAGSDLE